MCVHWESGEGDAATTALDLLTAVEGPLVRVTADAAYDTVAVYETAGARGATVVVPPARTANVSGHGPRSPARDRTITLVKTLGRRQWKKASGLGLIRFGGHLPKGEYDVDHDGDVGQADAAELHG